MASKSTDESDKAKPSRLIKWIREALLMGLVLIAVSTGLDVWRSQSMPQDEIPPLVAKSTTGEHIDLITRSHEKPVLVYFWGTWCSVCRFVSPTINWLDDSFDVVSIAVKSGDNRRLNAYLGHHEYGFTTINDNRGSLMQQWGISAVPSVFIIKDGEVSSVTTGFSTPPGLWLRMKMAS
ncbi:protein disulfide oxidoreductase [Photobacterium rosenbergii]|uniref:Protein disulfide oxidoreductase n=1 Tax=Photobacterium rosenbergii TaxID=294936 RepID=A0ABU3ZJF5_9GAMM|nr:protein disulfide oxidoreductase [Photobacterium rosenbergii]MDV5170242.1 protein disulfide oxidoreductase [Photobacterium rosenbergii]